MDICSNPGCSQPGISKCSACKATPYCGPICQTADWVHHKEECPGHLHKLGKAHLEKAKGFCEQRLWPQTLRYSDLALAKLKQMNDRPIEIIDEILTGKCYALNAMNRYREALECAKQRYCLHSIHYTHPPAIEASFRLIECCIVNGEFFDAALYARVLWETLTLSRDNHITEVQRQSYIARAAHELSRSTMMMAKKGGIPPGKKQAAGQEAIMLARKALEMHTQQHGIESEQVATAMGTLADVLGFFVGDEEVPRLLEQSIAIFARVKGTLTLSVAAGENNLGVVYQDRAKRAHTDNDLDRCVANWQLALPRYREAARIYRALTFVEKADSVTRDADAVEETLRQVTIVRAASKIR